MLRRLLPLLVCSIPLACGPAGPDPSVPPPATATAAPAASSASASASATASEAPKPPEMTAEEKKKADAARQLAEDRAKFDADAKAEEARLTAEFHADAKAVASKKYTSIDAAVTAALKGTYRKPAFVERDKYRHPLETLKFFGMKPTMTVLEYGPGEGWYTEVLAPVVAVGGKLFITTTDPKGPADARPTFYGERTQRTLALLPELYGKVESVVIDSKAPQLGMEGKLDMVLIIRALHNLHRDRIFSAVLAEVHKALKPNGIVGVVQHRAKPDANPDESALKGYLPEAFVISAFEAAGFKLAGKSEVNANPKDTKDYSEGVWTLPPTYRLKAQDKEKYAAIGESDRMTLKFTKVAKKK